MEWSTAFCVVGSIWAVPVFVCALASYRKENLEFEKWVKLNEKSDQ